MNLENRYDRNKSLISQEDQELLGKKTVAVIGAGGLGGYLAELSARLGVGRLIIIDGDVFEESNLNRQRFSNEHNLGNPKAYEAKRELERINSQVEITAVHDRISAENGRELLDGADLVLDGVDNARTRLLLQDICKQLQIPLVHGAIGGWYGQVSVVMPGDDTLSTIYSDPDAKGVEKDLGNPSFTPALIASYQVAEAVKLLLGKGENLRKKILYIDTLTNSTSVIDLE
ncbi:HesA/MoeB/ThiF family protein [Gudongella sp. SC589]|uniref:HesA/MoeB/ThiF family protein n=1 Tax=Gudongella sp. SC589 TaxID=3385990 RepID=UPI00390478CD